MLPHRIGSDEAHAELMNEFQFQLNEIILLHRSCRSGDMCYIFDEVQDLVYKFSTLKEKGYKED
jgi:hypothetical protein